MRAGKMRDVVIIQEKSVTRDVFGGEIVAWNNFATVWGQVTNLRLKDYIAAKASEVDLEMQVKVRYLAGVTASMRVKIGTNAWSIESVIDVDNRHTTLELLCCGPAVPT